jgi:IMP dehydrogenase
MDGAKTVEDAIRLMNRKKISAVIIMEKKETVGIFTERDVVRCYVTRKHDRRFREIPVREAMTTKLIMAEENDDICDVMSIMVEKNIRHLPVVDKGKVIAMLSIRDIIQAQVGRFTSEIHHLKGYIIS